MMADVQQPPNWEPPNWEAIRSEVLELTDKWKTAYAEKNPHGLTATLIFVFTFLFSAMSDLIELVEVASGIVKTAKKETVVSAFRYAYEQVNPDLPWIPEPFETKFENWILDSVLPTFIDWLVAKFNEKSIFTHEDDTAELPGPELDT